MPCIKVMVVIQLISDETAEGMNITDLPLGRLYGGLRCYGLHVWSTGPITSWHVFLFESFLKLKHSHV